MARDILAEAEAMLSGGQLGRVEEEEQLVAADETVDELISEAEAVEEDLIELAAAALEPETEILAEAVEVGEKWA